MNLFKLMGALKDMGKLQEDMKAVAEKIAAERFEGSAGGGMVRVIANGAMAVVSCTIDPQLLADNDRELLEQLVVSATNEAVAKARTYSAEVMQKTMTERFDLPGMEGIMKNFLPQ